MIYNANAPYEILQNKLIDFATMQRLRRFARYWDLIGNSGNFLESTPLLWHEEKSAFFAFLRWSDWLFGQIGRTDSIALPRLAEFLFTFLTSEVKLEPKLVAQNLWRDYTRTGRRDAPEILRPFAEAESEPRPKRQPLAGAKRQSRHVEIDVRKF